VPRGGQRQRTYVCDALNRILTAETTSTGSTSTAHCWAETYQYDTQTTGGAWGNLTGIGAAHVVAPPSWRRFGGRAGWRAARTDGPAILL
jgi:hypothetical protein